jgi:hypothetical protein
MTVQKAKIVVHHKKILTARQCGFDLHGPLEETVRGTVSGGLEKVASSFGKRATTCTGHVMFKSSPLHSKYSMA